MKQRILVVGLGEVGYRTAQLLTGLGIETVVVSETPNRRWASSLERSGVRIVEGDARALEVLLEAGLDGAEAVIACASHDLVNIEIALDVHRYDPTIRVILRLNDESLAEQLEAHTEIERAMAISSLSAPAFAAAPLGDAVLGTLVWQGDRHVLMRLNDDEAQEQFVIADEAGEKCEAMIPWPRWVERYQTRTAGLINLPSATMGKRRPIQDRWRAMPMLHKTLIGGLLGFVSLSTAVITTAFQIAPLEAFYFVITTITTVGYGDHTAKGQAPWVILYTCLMMLFGSATIAVIYSLITDALVSARFEALQGRKPTDLEDHVLVIGLGELGARVVKEYEAMRVPVAVVELNPDSRHRAPLAAETGFLVGDARETLVLERANLARAKAVVVTTDDDSVNLSIALRVKGLNPSVRTVIRSSEDRFAAKVQEVLQVDSALSAPRIAAPFFVASALFPQSLMAFESGSRLVILEDQSGSLKVRVLEFIGRCP